MTRKHRPTIEPQFPTETDKILDRGRPTEAIAHLGNMVEREIPISFAAIELAIAALQDEIKQIRDTVSRSAGITVGLAADSLEFRGRIGNLEGALPQPDSIKNEYDVD